MTVLLLYSDTLFHLGQFLSLVNLIRLGNTCQYLHKVIPSLKLSKSYLGQSSKISQALSSQYGQLIKSVGPSFYLFNVPTNQRTLQICQLAVQQSGLDLAYVLKVHKTLQICQLAVQQNGMALQ